MVKVVYGGAATGKTAFLLSIMKDALKKGVRTHYFIPEQSSLGAEKLVCREIDDIYKPICETHSFRRFQEIVFEDTVTFASFGPKGPGKTVLMSIALKTAENDLSVYNGSVSDCGFINELIKLYDEFKTYNTETDGIEALFDEKTASTAAKLKDIKLIFSIYESLCGGENRSKEEITAKLISENSLYKGDLFLFDGFDGFTPAENMIVTSIIKNASDAVFAFTTNTLSDASGGFGVFSDVISAVMSIKALCHENGIEYSEIKASGDFLPASFRYIENNLFEIKKSVYNDCKDIELYTVEDSYSEVSAAAAVICEGMANGCDYRDFTVLTPSSERYRSRFEAVFTSSGIPYFDDSRYTVAKQPLCRFLLSVASMFAFGVNKDNLLAALKTGVTGADEKGIASFENYLYLWNLKGWQLAPDKTFTRDPLKAFSEKPADNSALLESINKFKKTYSDPLYVIAESLRDLLPRDKVSALYNFLISEKVPENLSGSAFKLRESGSLLLAEEDAAVYDAVVSLFDELYSVLPDAEMDNKLFYDVFSAALSGLTAGAIPNRRDCVTVGEIGRSRNDRRRFTIILGVNDGLVPADVSESPVLCDFDRAVMKRVGITAPPASDEKQLRARLDVLRAFTGASEKLYIFRHAVDEAGKFSEPSYIFNDLINMFPECERRFDVDRFVVSRKLLYERYCRSIGSEASSEIRTVLEDDPGFKAFENRLNALAALGKKVSVGRELSKKIYNSALSYSSLEKYRNCAFSFFCNYGLKLRPRERFVVDAARIGSFIHWCFENAFRYGLDGKPFDTLTDAEIKILSEKLSDEYVERFFSSANEQSDRYNYLFERLSAYLCEMLVAMREENEQSEFVPTDFELNIGEDGDVKPIKIKTSSGIEAVMRGFIDRVDVYERGDDRFVRIIDYKKGDKKLDYSDVINGVRLQMYIYLFTLTENGQERFNGTVRPAAIMYRNKFGSHYTVQFGEDVKYSPLSTSGLFVDDVEVLKAMDKELQGKFIPVKETKKKTIDARSHVVSEDDFNEIKRYIGKKLAETAEELYNGNVTVSPLSCDYCDYKSVCGSICESKREAVKIKNAADLMTAIKEDEIDG